MKWVILAACIVAIVVIACITLAAALAIRGIAAVTFDDAGGGDEELR